MFEHYSAALSPHLIFGDVRLQRRYTYMIKEMGANFGQSIPRCFSEFKDTKAAYDFFSNERMKHFMIIEAERARLVEHISQSRPQIVLAVQDTTELDFTGHRSASSLGSLNYVAQKGFLAHNHCLFTSQGVALGVFDQKLWGRDADTLGQNKAKRKQRSLEEKESYRWLEHFNTLQRCFASLPQTTFIEIGDQESDIQEVLQARDQAHIHYVLRSRGDRNLADESKTIRKAVLGQAVQGCYSIEVKDDKTGKIRKACLEVRFTSASVNARHQHKRKISPVEVGFVMVSEINPPQDAQAVEWVLSTSLPLQSLEDALQIIYWYCLRWRIETFHYVLKQGCAVEKLQLEEPRAIQIAIATYSLMAMQVLRLRYLAQTQPQLSLQAAGFDKQQYKVAAIFLNASKAGNYDVHKKDPTVAEFAKMVAQLGGSILQKNKPFGVKAIWRGIRDLQILMQAFRAFSDA